MQKIKAVLFDFGGVVANEGFQEWISKNLAPYEKVASEISDLERKVNRGDLPESAYNEELAKRANKNPSAVQSEILNGYIIRTDVIDIVLKLKKNNIKTAILSNFPKNWFNILRERFHLDTIFDMIFVSAEMHLIKPDEEIFNKALAVLSVAPDETVFIDDKKNAVDTANSLGMYGILFTSQEDIVKHLLELGVAV